MMTCQQCEELWLDQEEQSLPLESSLLLTQHLDFCSACAVRQKTYQKTSLLCQQVFTVDAPEDLSDSVLAFVHQKCVA